eukprot:TRINITY_DN4500_c0_g1_i1.p1 TRINITY_DN4500_c0_g1~~TRINITY_DN4500_c0_g1_i1.p1  ORF type:complete len:414 (+),score=85.33 TRINITY_DN4500_c0_g1_i1:82-1242(+)
MALAEGHVWTPETQRSRAPLVRCRSRPRSPKRRRSPPPAAGVPPPPDTTSALHQQQQQQQQVPQGSRRVGGRAALRSSSAPPAPAPAAAAPVPPPGLHRPAPLPQVPLLELGGRASPTQNRTRSPSPRAGSVGQRTPRGPCTSPSASRQASARSVIPGQEHQWRASSSAWRSGSAPVQAGPAASAGGGGGSSEGAARRAPSPRRTVQELIDSGLLARKGEKGDCAPSGTMPRLSKAPPPDPSYNYAWSEMTWGVTPRISVTCNAAAHLPRRPRKQPLVRYATHDGRGTLWLQPASVITAASSARACSPSGPADFSPDASAAQLAAADEELRRQALGPPSSSRARTSTSPSPRRHRGPSTSAGATDGPRQTAGTTDGPRPTTGSIDD